MSDTVYNAGKYLKFSSSEYFGIIITALFASFVLAFPLKFSNGLSVDQSALPLWGLLFIFLTLAFLITIILCKIVAIRTGYVVTYNYHAAGLILGAIFTIITAGYLPLFIPGGFSYDQPERLRVGKWHGYHKGWEVGLIAATFPLLMIAWVLALNPLYLITQASLFIKLITATCLSALFACIPIPGIGANTKGEPGDFWEYLHGTTFGLEVFYSSRAWWMALCITVLIFWLLAFLLTISGVHVGILIYVLSMLLAGICVFVYYKFFHH